MIAATLLLVASAASAQPGAPAVEPAGSGTSATTASTASASAELASVPEEPTEIGRPTELTVNVSLPPGAEIVSVRPVGTRFVERAETPLTPAEALAAGEPIPLRLRSFRPGTHRLDAIEVTYIDGSGAQRTARTGPLTLEVRSVTANENDPAPRGDRPPHPVLTTNMLPIYLAGGGALLAVGLLIGLWWRRRARPEIAPPPVPARPPHETALEALDELEGAGLLARGEIVDFHRRLSEVLRTYIGAHSRFHAPEMTTWEIARWMERHPSSFGDYAAEIRRLLERTDLVKFAKVRLADDESRSMLQSLRDLVLDLSASARAAEEESEEAAEPPPPPAVAVEEPDSDAVPSPPLDTDAGEGESQDKPSATPDRDEEPR